MCRCCRLYIHRRNDTPHLSYNTYLVPGFPLRCNGNSKEYLHGTQPFLPCRKQHVPPGFLFYKDLSVCCRQVFFYIQAKHRTFRVTSSCFDFSLHLRKSRSCIGKTVSPGIALHSVLHRTRLQTGYVPVLFSQSPDFPVLSVLQPYIFQDTILWKQRFHLPCCQTFYQIPCFMHLRHFILAVNILCRINVIFCPCKVRISIYKSQVSSSPVTPVRTSPFLRIVIFPFCSSFVTATEVVFPVSSFTLKDSVFSLYPSGTEISFKYTVSWVFEFPPQKYRCCLWPASVQEGFYMHCLNKYQKQRRTDLLYCSYLFCYLYPCQVQPLHRKFHRSTFFFKKCPIPNILRTRTRRQY